MEATDSIRVLDRPDWHPGKNKPVRVISTDFLAGSLRFCGFGLSRIALQRLSKTEHAQEQTRLSKSQVGRHHGSSRWNFATRLNISMEEEASCKEEEAKEEGRQSRVTTALGQAVCPTGLEGSSGRSSRFVTQMNVELSIYA
ncbi:hypothetical protein CRG98_007597 [Punica granatum]|uniref:Uncharacterized protein n=1 Tax=Punica granatum TaxID=22663 RepID=A0A2I0KU43_PUNGR|nr:hypothetical protein CRG98_007597 [Punica granatum]